MVLETVKGWLDIGTVANEILKNRRQYFGDKVKKPLMKALVILASRYPEPTKENTKRQNTHILMDIWDEFFQYENNRGRDPLFRAVRKLTLDEYEHDGYYSQRIDWFLERLVERYLSGEWRPPSPWNPSECWTEPSAVEALKRAREEFMQTGTVKWK